MRQLRCIATYSRRLGAPQNMWHPKSQYAATRHVLFTTTVRMTEFMSAKINNDCLDSRRQDWLHCLTRLTNCRQHNHVSSTHARAHALWCAMKRDWLTHHTVTYLTCDGFRFCVMTLTFDLITFNFGSESAVTWQNRVSNFRQKKRKIRGRIHWKHS